MKNNKIINKLLFFLYLSLTLIVPVKGANYSLADSPSKNLNLMQKTVGNVIGLGAAYYLSRYPKVLGAFEVIDLFFDPHYEEGDAFYNTPPIVYNFLFVESDVGDESRLEVFAINAGLMIGGHLFYKTFIKEKNSQDRSKEKEISQSKVFQVMPILNTNYQGLIATYRF